MVIITIRISMSVFLCTADTSQYHHTYNGKEHAY